jgi:hypothetical protein
VPACLVSLLVLSRALGLELSSEFPGALHELQFQLGWELEGKSRLGLFLLPPGCQLTTPKAVIAFFMGQLHPKVYQWRKCLPKKKKKNRPALTKKGKHGKGEQSSADSKNNNNTDPRKALGKMHERFESGQGPCAGEDRGRRHRAPRGCSSEFGARGDSALDSGARAAGGAHEWGAHGRKRAPARGDPGFGRAHFLLAAAKDS